MVAWLSARSAVVFLWFLQWVSLGGCQYGFHLRLSVWVSLGDSCGGCFFVVVVVVFFFRNFCGCFW